MLGDVRPWNRISPLRRRLEVPKRPVKPVAVISASGQGQEGQAENALFQDNHSGDLPAAKSAACH